MALPGKQAGAAPLLEPAEQLTLGSVGLDRELWLWKEEHGWFKELPVCRNARFTVYPSEQFTE